MNAARLRVLRQICGRCRFKASGHGTDSSVLAELGELPTDLLLLQRRLAAAFRTLDGAPKILVALRFCQSTASAALAEDLAWAWQAAPTLRSLPDPRQDPRPWLELVSHPFEWKRALSALDPSFSRMRARDVTPEFFDATVSAPPASAPFVCMQCPPERRRCCTSNRGLRSHMFRAHAVGNDARFFVQDSSCPVCKKVFSSRPAAIDHLAYRAKRCRDALASLSPLAVSTVARLDLADRDKAREIGWTACRGHA